MAAPRAVVAVAAVLAAAACGKPGSASPPPPGAERGACYGNGTCNDGLTCLSDRCVRAEAEPTPERDPWAGPEPRPSKQPAAGMADCAAVAEAVVSLELGNYAPRDQRAGRVTDLAALCRAQFVTAAEATCLLAATRKDDLGLCAKPLIVKPLTDAEKLARKATSGLPAECDAYIAAIERYATCSAFPADTRQSLRQTVDQLRSSWQQMLGPQSPPSTRQAVGDACRQGVDSIRQAMAQLGC